MTQTITREANHGLLSQRIFVVICVTVWKTKLRSPRFKCIHFSAPEQAIIPSSHWNYDTYDIAETWRGFSEFWKDIEATSSLFHMVSLLASQKICIFLDDPKFLLNLVSVFSKIWRCITKYNFSCSYRIYDQCDSFFPKIVLLNNLNDTASTIFTPKVEIRSHQRTLDRRLCSEHFNSVWHQWEISVVI